MGLKTLFLNLKNLQSDWMVYVVFIKQSIY